MQKQSSKICLLHLFNLFIFYILFIYLFGQGWVGRKLVRPKPSQKFNHALVLSQSSSFGHFPKPITCIFWAGLEYIARPMASNSG